MLSQPKKIFPKFVSPILGKLGEDFTIEQIHWNTKNTRFKRWHCKRCRYIWKGIQRLRVKHTPPLQCTKCKGRGTVEEISVKHGDLMKIPRLNKQNRQTANGVSPDIAKAFITGTW